MSPKIEGSTVAPESAYKDGFGHNSTIQLSYLFCLLHCKIEIDGALETGKLNYISFVDRATYAN